MEDSKERKEEIKQKIDILIDEYFEILEKEEYSKLYPLVSVPYNAKEVKEAIESLLSTFVTMGKKCYQFEEDFSKYIGTKYGLFVNSGSTANLLALKILASPVLDNPIKPGSEIITPAITWSTTVFPIYDIDSVPVFVDVNPDTMTMKINDLENAITDKTRAIMPVHLLGNPCDMDKIMEIADDHDLFVIEDCCEAHGAKIKDRMIGSYGHISTFSFFFSHHISTIEGGIVLTNNLDYLKIGKSLRAHGWARERSDKKEIAEKYPEIDSRFLFIQHGYNFRPTEIQGAFGIHQIPKLEGFVESRIKSAEILIDNLSKYDNYIICPKFLDDCRQSWFGFPIIVKEDAPFTVKELSQFLEQNQIETRQIMGGNFVQQPVMKELVYKSNKLPNSQFVFENGLFIGLHNKFDKKRISAVIDVFTKFFEKIETS